MEANKAIETLTQKEQEKIIKEVTAFLFNYEYLSIKKYAKRYYIFMAEEQERDNNWVYNAENIHELKGWLYGCVQAVGNSRVTENRKGRKQ